MKLTLKSLRIINFKGIKELFIQFKPNENFILGKNGAGKTTISDAYHWLMTGKDSTDSKEFAIKPIVDGEPTQKMENEVEGVFEIDGETIILKKVHSENWVKPKGSIDSVFKGNETTYFWNAGPVTMKAYQEKISAIIPDSKLKLFSNTGYFQSLNWTDRRAVLLDIAGGIDKDAIIGSDKNFAFIGEFLSQKKSFIEFRKQVAMDKKRAKDEKDEIPVKIGEVKRNSTTLERPFGRLKEELSKLQTELAGIESSIHNKNEAYKVQDDNIQQLRKKKYGLQTRSENIKAALQTSISAKVNVLDEIKLKLDQDIVTAKNNLQIIETSAKHLNDRIIEGNKQITNLKASIAAKEDVIRQYRERWSAENKVQLVIDEMSFHCPTCKREYEESDKFRLKQEELRNFNSNKKAKLDNLVIESKEVKDAKELQEATLKTYDEAILDCRKQIDELKAKHSEAMNELKELEINLNDHLSKPKAEAVNLELQLATQLDEHQEYNTILDQIKALEQELAEFKPVDNTILINRQKEIRAAIDELTSDLQNEKIIKDNVARIQELEEQQLLLAQRIADLEKKEYYMFQFNMKQNAEIENTVNSMFDYVQFRMFSKQVNGELIEDCVTLVDGNPIDSNAVNTARMVNAGVDIINTLSKHYNTYVPMFIDGRESVTELIHTDSQIINLIVSPIHDKLTIKESISEMAVA